MKRTLCLLIILCFFTSAVYAAMHPSLRAYYVFFDKGYKCGKNADPEAYDKKEFFLCDSNIKKVNPDFAYQVEYNCHKYENNPKYYLLKEIKFYKENSQYPYKGSRILTNKNSYTYKKYCLVR